MDDMEEILKVAIIGLIILLIIIVIVAIFIYVYSWCYVLKIAETEGFQDIPKWVLWWSILRR